MKTVNADLMCMSLTTDMTDDEIKDCIQQMMPVCLEKQQGFCLTISGYDNDKRELWDIPEATKFMKKLVDFGLIGILEVTTTSPDLMGETAKKLAGRDGKLPGFGALEIWMCATGRMSKGKNDVSRNEMALFIQDLEKANQKSREIYEGPKINTNLKANTKITQIADAPIRHGYNRKER